MDKLFCASLLAVMLVCSAGASADTFIVKNFKSSSKALQTYQENGKRGALLDAGQLNAKTQSFTAPVIVIAYDAAFSMAEILFSDGSSHFVSIRDIEVNDESKEAWKALVSSTSRNSPTLCLQDLSNRYVAAAPTPERNNKGISSCNL